MVLILKTENVITKSKSKILYGEKSMWSVSNSARPHQLAHEQLKWMDKLFTLVYINGCEHRFILLMIVVL